MIDLTELGKRIEAGLVLADKHLTEDLCIYNYTKRAQYDRVWDEYTRICRGLILDSGGNIISRPFPKFFNLNETPETTIQNLPNEIPKITEKMDGMLGISYPENRNISIATRGRFKSPFAIWATEWLRKQGYVYADFREEYTYCFEIIYPGSKIVVDYGTRTELVLLAVINIANTKELNFKKEAEELGLSYVPEYRFKNLDEAEEWLSGFKGTEKEGLVLHYKNGLRIKIKSDDYKRIHKILTGISAKDIWASLKAGASLDPILELAPDELYQWIKDTERELVKEKDGILNSARAVSKEAAKLSTRKEQAAFVLKYPSIKGIVFSFLDGREEDAEQGAWDIVKPSGEEKQKRRR